LEQWLFCWCHSITENNYNIHMENWKDSSTSDKDKPASEHQCLIFKLDIPFDSQFRALKLTGLLDLAWHCNTKCDRRPYYYYLLLVIF
jgi:hypothetical protein